MAAPTLRVGASTPVVVAQPSGSSAQPGMAQSTNLPISVASASAEEEPGEVDSNISVTGASSPVLDTSSSTGTKPKVHKPDTRIKVGGWNFTRGNKRNLQLSPNKSPVETSNRFEALDPFSPLITSHPAKKLALTTSCSDLRIGEEKDQSGISPMEESTPVGDKLNNICAANPLDTTSNNSSEELTTLHGSEHPSKLPGHSPSSHHPKKGFWDMPSKPKPNKLTRPSASTKPSVSTKPSASTNPSASTQPSASTKSSASTKPSVSPKPSASTKDSRLQSKQGRPRSLSPEHK